MAEDQDESTAVDRKEVRIDMSSLYNDESTAAGDDGAFSSQSPTPTAVTSDNDAGHLHISGPTGLAPQTTESKMNGALDEVLDGSDLESMNDDIDSDDHDDEKLPDGTDKTVEQNNAPMPPTSEPLKDLETSPQLEKKEMEEEALTKAGHLPDEEEKEINTRNDSANILMASGDMVDAVEPHPNRGRSEEFLAKPGQDEPKEPKDGSGSETVTGTSGVTAYALQPASTIPPGPSTTSTTETSGEPKGTSKMEEDHENEKEEAKEYQLKIKLPFDGNTYKISLIANEKEQFDEILKRANDELKNSYDIDLDFGQNWLTRSSLFLAKDDEEIADDKGSSRRSSVSSNASNVSQASIESKSKKSGMFSRRKRDPKPTEAKEVQFQPNKTLEQFITKYVPEMKRDPVKLEWKFLPIDIVVKAVYNGELKEHTFEWDKDSAKKSKDLLSALNVGDNSSIPKEMSNGLWFVESAQRYTDAPYAVIKAVAADTKSERNGNANTTLNPSIPSDSLDDDVMVLPEHNSKSNDTCITFDASDSRDRDNKDCEHFIWDFGDGTETKTTKTSKVDHSFQNHGIYSVKCTVVDAEGNTAICSMQQVIDGQKDINSVSVGSSVVAAIPNEMVHFYASVQKADELQYRWYFGDGKEKTSDIPRIAHIFKETGSYSVRVEVSKPSDNGQCTLKQSATLQQRVCGANPDPPAVVIVVDSQSGHKPKSDSKKQTSKVEEHINDIQEENNGDFQEKDNGQVQEEDEQKYLEKGSDDKDDDAHDGSVLVTFDASKSVDKSGAPCTEFRFNFGDGSDIKESVDGKATHQYTAEGTYLVTVVAIDEHSNRGCASLTHRIESVADHKQNDLENELQIDDKQEEPANGSEDRRSGALTDITEIEDKPKVEAGKGKGLVTKLRNLRGNNNQQKGNERDEDHGDNQSDSRQILRSFSRSQMYPYFPVSMVNKSVSFKVLFEDKHISDQSEVWYQWDFGDGETSDRSKKPKCQHSYKNPGSYSIVVSILEKKQKEFKRLDEVVCTHRVMGKDAGDLKSDDDGSKKTLSATIMQTKQRGDFNAKDLREEKFDDETTLRDFVDHLRAKNIAVGRRLYLEWRPRVSNVMIDLSFKGQSTQWKCSWSDVAEWKCQDILNVTKHFYIAQGAETDVNGDVDDAGTPTLWLAESKEVHDDEQVKETNGAQLSGLLAMGAIAEDKEDEIKKRYKEFQFLDGVNGHTINQFIGLVGEANQKEIQNNGLLHLKMRRIPSEIDIDLSSLKTGIEDIKFTWDDARGIKNKKQKEILKQLESDENNYKSNCGPLLDKYCNVWLQLKYEESSLDQQRASSPEPSDAEDDGKDDEKDDVKPKEGSVKWTDSETMEDLVLKLIDNGNSLGNTLHLELRHNLEDIRIAVSYGKLDGELSFKWGEIADKECGAILDDIQKELKQENNGGDVPGKERAALWYQPPADLKQAAAADITSIPFPTNNLLWKFLLEDSKRKRLLKDLNGPLRLKWMCPPEIILSSVDDGVLREQSIDWNTDSGKKYVDLFKTVQKNLSITDLERGGLWFDKSAQRNADAPYAIIKALNGNIKLNAVEKSENEHSQHTTITFDASDSCDRDGADCSHFVWDFGDGTEPTMGPTVPHTFKELGIYSVKCTVIDSKGNMAICSMQQVIGGEEKNTNSLFIKSSGFEAIPKQRVNFYASHLKNDEKERVYHWNFDDGTVKDSKIPRTSHIFNEAGSYSVRVEVSEPKGKGQRTLRRSATLQQRVCNANPNRPAVVIVSETKEETHDSVTVTFDASGSLDKAGNQCTLFLFDFGDGSEIMKSYDGKVDYEYKEEDKYWVTVIAEDANGNRGTASLMHKIDKMEKAKQEDGVTSKLNFIGTFKMFGNNDQEDNDDEEDATGSGGDSNGKFRSLPSSQIDSFRPFSAVKQPVSFRVIDGESSTKRPNDAFQWDFGDGVELKPVRTSTMEHTYKQPGSYTITVTILGKNKTEISRSVCTHYVFLESDGDPDMELHVEDTKEESKSEQDPKDEQEPDVQAEPKDEQNPKEKEPRSDGVADKEEGPKVEEEVEENAADAAGRKIEENRQKLAKKGETVSFSCTIRNSESAERPSRKILIFDFGDDSSLKICKSELATTNVQHEFKRMGTYQVTVTAIDSDGRGGYATISVLVLGDDAEEKKRKPQVFLKAEQVAEDKSFFKFDVSGSMTRKGKPLLKCTVDFGDGKESEPFENEKIEDIKRKYDKPGIYCVTVTGWKHSDYRAIARMRLRVLGEKPPEKKKVDTNEQNQSRWVNKMGAKEKADFNVQDLKPIQCDTDKTPREFVDYLKEMNIPMEKRLYLEWRPPIRDVLIYWSLNDQSTSWKCSWGDFAQWTCKEMLDMTEQLSGEKQSTDHGTKELGKATLWWDSDDQSKDDNDSNANRSNQFTEKQTMDEFTRDVVGNAAKNMSTLRLKMRYIPTEIVIDLSSLKQVTEMIPLPWDGTNTVKNIKEQLRKRKEYKALKVDSTLEAHFSIFFKCPSDTAIQDQLHNVDEYGREEEKASKLEPQDTENNTEDAPVINTEKNMSEFSDGMNMQDFTLPLIDSGRCQGKQLQLILRHIFEDIKITVSYCQWFEKRDITFKYGVIVDKDCNAILDDIAGTLNTEKPEAKVPDKDGAALWFNAMWKDEMHHVEDEAEHYDKDKICKAEWKLIDFIKDLKKSEHLKLDHFKGPLHLEWRQLISGIKFHISYHGQYLRSKLNLPRPIPWNAESKKWTSDNNLLKQQIMKNGDLPDELDHVLVLKTTDPESDEIQWIEWNDGSNIKDFVSELLKKEVRLEGDLVLLWKHLPKKVFVDLPYFGEVREEKKEAEDGGASFSMEITKDNGIMSFIPIGQSESGWFGLRSMTSSDLMKQVEKNENFRNLKWPPEFKAQLWWLWKASKKNDDDEVLNQSDAVCMVNYENKRNVSSIFCEIRVGGSKSPKSNTFLADDTGSNIVSWFLLDLEVLNPQWSHSDDAYSRLYLDGDSQEKMVTFPPEMTLTEFMEIVSMVMHTKGVQYDEQQYDEKNPLKLVYVEIKELPFDGTGNANKEEAKSLEALMKTLESKGVDFEEGELHLEWRPSATDIDVDVLYEGHDQTVHLKWPKWDDTHRDSIMNLIEKEDVYKGLKVPDIEKGIPMLWFVATESTKSNEHTEPEADSANRQMINREMQLNVVDDEDERVARKYGFNVNRRMINFNMERPKLNMGGFGDYNNWLRVGSNATTSDGDKSGKAELQTLLFEEGWTLHELAAKVYEQEMKIYDHIHLELRFVPKTVVVEVPFGKRILPSKYVLYDSESTESENQCEWQKWTDVNRKKCSEIKRHILDKDDKFKKIVSMLDNSDWDLWYVGRKGVNPESMQEQRSDMTASTETSEYGLGDEYHDQQNKSNISELALDQITPETSKATDVDDEDIDTDEKKMAPIKFESDMDLEQFVLMLRKKKGIEPGDKMHLEYRRVPKEIAVDLSYFDVGETAQYPMSNVQESDSQYELSIDLTYQELMAKVRDELFKRYGVPKEEDDAFLYVHKKTVLDFKKSSEVLTIFRDEKNGEEKKESEQNDRAIAKGKGKSKREKKSPRGRRKKGGKVSQKAQNSQQSTLPKVDECTEFNDYALVNDNELVTDGWQWKVDKNSDDVNGTIRDFLECLRKEKGVELEGKMTLKWDHAIPEEKKLNLQFELIDAIRQETKTTEKLVVHRYETYRKLIETVQNDPSYKKWRQSINEEYGDGNYYRAWGTPDPSAENRDYTLYFNSETAGSKASKMMIFEKEQTLDAFFEQLEEGMVTTSELDTLQYLEGPRDRKTVYYCKLCGNDVPRTMPRTDLKTGNKHDYLNPHAILYFRRDIDQKHKKSEKLCPQCLYFSNLEIDTTDDDDAQTTNQYLLIATGIFLSPAIWIGVALPLSDEAFIFVSIIAMFLSAVILGCVLLYGNSQSNQNNRKMKRIKEWFRDPYHLASDLYIYWLVSSLFILNLLNLLELWYLYRTEGWNAAFVCSTGLDYPPECVVYLELIGASIIVLLATLFINIAICRRPTGIGQDADEFRAAQGKSFKTLKGKLKEHEHRGKVTMYYKFAIDAMEEVRISQAPSSVANGFIDYDKNCCGRNRTFKIPTVKFLGFVGVASAWTLAMLVMSFVVHQEVIYGLFGDEFNFRRIVSILMSYFIVVVSLRFFVMTMYRLNAMLHKAYMLMKIPSNPMSFIGRNDSKNPEQPTVPDTDKNDDQKVKMKKLFGELRMKTNHDEERKDDQNDQEESVQFQSRARHSRKSTMRKSHAFRYDEDNEEELQYLDARTSFLDPTFLMAWWNLRQHIENYELNYFFELTNPIISFEIMFVFAMFVWTIIGFLRPDYDRDVQRFIREAIARSNVLLVLALFLLAIVIGLLGHLYHLMKPYNVQLEHEQWIDKMLLKLEFEATHFCEDGTTRQSKIEKRMELLRMMKEEMSRSRTAPKLLGVIELRESRIQFIISSVVVPLAYFATSSVQSYVLGSGDDIISL